jgi:hypothetical protein
VKSHSSDERQAIMTRRNVNVLKIKSPSRDVVLQIVNLFSLFTHPSRQVLSEQPGRIALFQKESEENRDLTWAEKEAIRLE